MNKPKKVKVQKLHHSDNSLNRLGLFCWGVGVAGFTYSVFFESGLHQQTSLITVLLLFIAGLIVDLERDRRFLARQAQTPVYIVNLGQTEPYRNQELIHSLGFNQTTHVVSSKDDLTRNRK